MLFTTAMMPILLLSSMVGIDPLYPLSYAVDPGVVVPSIVPELYRSIRRLRIALAVAPVAGAGAVFLGRAAVVIRRDYLEWRKKHPYDFETYRASKGGSYYSSPDGSGGYGWGWGGSPPEWVKRVHDRYDRSNYRAHRTVDFLAFELNRIRLRASDYLRSTGERLYARAAEEDHGWSAGPAYVTTYQSAPAVAVVPVAVPPAPVAVPVYSPAPAPHYHSGGDYVPYGSEVSPYYKPAAGSVTSYEYSGAAPPPPSPRNKQGTASSYSGYSSSPSQGNARTGTRPAKSSRPGRDRGSLDVEFQAAPLNVDEFTQLMNWANGGRLEYNPSKQVGGGVRLTRAPGPPRNVRIKRQKSGSVPAAPSTPAKPRRTKTATTTTARPSYGAGFVDDVRDTFLNFFTGDIRRFFTVLEYLNQDQCLQKMICDIHLTAKSLPATEISFYELSIVNLFRILDTFMPWPADEQARNNDSSYKYRNAARQGYNATSDQYCSNEYKECSQSTKDIISWNYKIDAEVEAEDEAGTDTISTTKKPKTKVSSANKPKNKKTTTTAATPINTAGISNNNTSTSEIVTNNSA